MTNLENNSGEGKNSVVLDIVAKKFNWGAFWFTWIWGLFNKSYITLIFLGLGILAFLIKVFLTFGIGLFQTNQDSGMVLFLTLICVELLIGIVSLTLRIYFGIKGNRWAWQNKRWESIQKFHEVQKVWAIVGTIIVGFFIMFGTIGIVAAMTIPSLVSNTNQAKNRAMMLKSISTLEQSALMNVAYEHKCKLSSEELAKCFARNFNDSATLSENEVFWDYSGDKYTFIGDGKCTSDNACYVILSSTKSDIEETIRLYPDKEGFIQLDRTDTENLINKYKFK